MTLGKQVIREAIGNGGRISRERVYELDNRDETQMLRGFTRPVTRVTAELQFKGVLPYNLPVLLNAGYEGGVKSSHFSVPLDVVQLFKHELESPGLELGHAEGASAEES